MNAVVPSRSDLGGGVEAQPEHDPDRVDLPLLVDGPHPAGRRSGRRSPRLSSCRSSSASSYSPRRIDRKTRTIPARITRFIAPMRNKNVAEMRVPNTPPNCCRLESLSDTAQKTVFSAMMIPTPIATTIVEWPSEKKNPNENGRGWPVPCRSCMHLAGGVVDGRDVVGVEGVPQARGCRPARSRRCPGPCSGPGTTKAMKTKKPIACRAKIRPYIAVTRRRSTGDIAMNDVRTIRPIRAGGGLVASVTGRPSGMAVSTGSLAR